MKYSKILILRLSAAGDIVLTFPAFFFLASGIGGGCVIDWAVDERFADLLDLLPGVNKKILFPSKTLKSKTASYIAKARAAWNFIKEIRRGGYDLVIDFQGLFKSGAVSFLSGCRARAAFAPGGHDSREFNHWLNNKIISVPETGPLASKIIYRSLCLAAGAIDAAPPGGYQPRKLITPPGDNAKINSFIDEISRAGSGGNDLSGVNGSGGYNYAPKIIVLNPFTNWPTKTWPADKWIELVKLIRRDEILKKSPAVILWGPAEKAAAESIAASDGLSFISPPTSFKEVFSLIDRSDAVISGDSFALHAAFILNKPAAALFGASDPARCAPFGDKTALVTQKLDCQHCFKKICPLCGAAAAATSAAAAAANACITGITPQEVLTALHTIIR